MCFVAAAFFASERFIIFINFKFEYFMCEIDLQAMLVSAHLVPADHVPESFSVTGVSVNYLNYMDSLTRIVEAFEADRQILIGNYTPFTRTGIKTRFPKLESVSVRWNTGPRKGDAYWYTEELWLGEWTLPGFLVLKDGVIHAGDSSARESFWDYWKCSESFQCLGTKDSIKADAVREGEIWISLKKFVVFYRHKGVHPTYYGEDRWRHHPDPEPFWSHFVVRAGSDKLFGQLFEV